ncbi:hypothetical protein A2392_03350 [Candidatus Kaiserbacteria bacterium RIFOXYB1_FULL_46_14]|uniref:Glycosyltransferase 2-like domain-containing protein n=1 Tax=Candidatus Kaiserbacteria bacterium RIFOXYB1_FULL_46_14 TaxID=1798531 RepID=A0A1F6FI16_9BACT|nr:MAG: hypothetical protein A2392_03350 [Candidatus Kaiserbacteria bacterium RIFOXYB1_FULL_46_14]
MKTPILSICIPTYNRAHHLANALESILCQLEDSHELSPLVEVVVSDNASLDDTRSVVLHYQSLIPNLIYSRNEENIGFDYNTLRAVQSATGTYCWYLGDDDIIINGALNVVVGICRDLTFDIGGTNIELLTKESDWKKRRIYTPDDTVVMHDPNKYYFNGYCQGTLSALIFRRDSWLEVVPKDNFIEGWLYYETVLCLLGRSQKQFFISKPMIMAGDDCRWAENGGELFTYINSNAVRRRMLDWGFDISRMKEELRRNEKQLPLFLLRAKGHGLPITLKNLRFIWINMHHVGLVYLIWASLIFFIPNPIIRLIRDARKHVSSTL